MGIDAVIFDLDDTLIEEQAVDTGVLAEVCAEAGERFGFDAEGLDGDVIAVAEEHLPLSGQATDRGAVELSWSEALWGPFEAGDLGVLGVTWEAIHDFRATVWDTALLHVTDRRQDATDWCSQQLVSRRAETQPVIPGARTLLGEVRAAGLRVGLLTNGAVCVQEAKLARCGLGAFCDEVVISGALPWPKPDARAFEETMARLGTTAANCAMVGNSPFHDIEPARNLGLVTVLFQQSPVPGAAVPDDAITRLDRVLPHLVPDSRSR